MGFLEEEKKRLEKRLKKKKEKKKHKEKKIKEKKERLEKKRKKIYNKFGTFMEKLQKKTQEKQNDARLHGLSDPLESRFDNPSNWEWKLDFYHPSNKIRPRLWGCYEKVEPSHFLKVVKFSHQKEFFDSEGRATIESFNEGYWSMYETLIGYIQCLFDTDNMIIEIKAQGEKHEKTYYEKDDRSTVEHDTLQPSYLSNGDLKFKITKKDLNDDKIIDNIADILIEIRYTWECERAEFAWINDSKLPKRLKSYLNIYDDLQRKKQSIMKIQDNLKSQKNEKSYEINKKQKKSKNIDLGFLEPDTFSLIIGVLAVISVPIIFLIDMNNYGFLNIVALIILSLITGPIVGAITAGIVFLLMHLIKMVIKSFYYTYNSNDREYKIDHSELDSLDSKINSKSKKLNEIKNKLKHKEKKISELLNSLNNNKSKLICDDKKILELPLYNIKDNLKPKVNKLVKNSKYEY